MRIRKGGKAMINGDRTRRVNELLGTSGSAAEALIKRCSQSTLATSSQAAPHACEDIIQHRRTQYDDSFEDLKRVLRHATWLESACDGRDKHFFKWTQTISQEYGDREVSTKLKKEIKRARSTSEKRHEDEFYLTHQSLAHEKGITKAVAKQLEEMLAGAKAAKSKSGKKTGAKSKGKGKTPSTEPSDDVNKSGVREASRSPRVALRPIKFEIDDYAGKVKALRDLVGELRSLSLELVALKRALRFMHNFFGMQEWHSMYSEECSVEDDKPMCSSCGDEAERPTETFILGICGHIVCHECLLSPDRDAKCPAPGCDAAAQDCNAFGASEFGSETSDVNEDCHYGKKIEDVVRLLKEIVGKEEQAILFVQFDDLMENIAAVLEEQDLSHFALTRKSGPRHGKMMDEFQQDTSPARKNVLLLNPTHQSAAGVSV